MSSLKRLLWNRLWSLRLIALTSLRVGPSRNGQAGNQQELDHLNILMRMKRWLLGGYISRTVRCKNPNVGYAFRRISTPQFSFTSPADRLPSPAGKVAEFSATGF
jgi:hypothetical protein